MSKSTDWLPNSRDGILAMAGDWISVCTTQKNGWNIPDQALTDFAARRDAAAAALETAKNETTRTPVATAQCKEAFDALTAFMRDFKRRYFLSPPLLDSDYISLGLKPHDSTPTASRTPTAQVTVETHLLGRHELGVKLSYVTGNPGDPANQQPRPKGTGYVGSDRYGLYAGSNTLEPKADAAIETALKGGVLDPPANKGYRIWYSVIAPGETLPANPDDLRKSFFTKRKKDMIEFEFGDSGKTACLAAQIENDGKKGPWGPLVQALIP